MGLLGLRHLHPRGYMPLFKAAGDLEVVAVAEGDGAVLESFTREFGVRGYLEWPTMIEREPLDLAMLFLPHADCPEAAVACAQRGLHVVVEKPMAADSTGVRLMIAAARASRVLLSTPYVWRYHPVAQEIRRLIQNEALGQIIGCQGRCAAGRLQRYLDGHASWMLVRSRSGGGPMYNLGVHWIDLYRWFLADEVVEVLSKNVKVNQAYDVEDNSFALLTFSRGPVLALDISYTVPDSYPYGRDLFLAVRGTRGVVSWSPSFEGTHETLWVCSDAPDEAGGLRRLDFELPAQPGYTGILGVHFWRDIAQAIRAGAEPPIAGEDGLRALEVVEAVYRAAQSGCAALVRTRERESCVRPKGAE